MHTIKKNSLLIHASEKIKPVSRDMTCEEIHQKIPNTSRRRDKKGRFFLLPKVHLWYSLISEKPYVLRKATIAEKISHLLTFVYTMQSHQFLIIWKIPEIFYHEWKVPGILHTMQFLFRLTSLIHIKTSGAAISIVTYQVIETSAMIKLYVN